MCTRCKRELDICCFNIQKSSKDGHCSICKECRAEMRKLNKEQIAEYNRKYRQEHSEYFTEYAEEHKKHYLEYRQNHKEEKAQYDKLYHAKIENKQRKQAYDKTYYRQNIDKIRQYKQNNKEKIKIRLKRYRSDNSDKIKQNYKRYYINNIKNNSQALLNKNISNAINASLHGAKAERHWENLVGYTLQDLINHLEKQFDKRMNWNNHSIHGWHIDHIIPKESLPYDSPDDQNFKIVWSLQNLRPLWCTDNWSRPKDGSDISNIEEFKLEIVNKI